MIQKNRLIATGFLTGYASIIVNTIYTIISVRLALGYLGKQEFGLWSLVLQLAGYMLLFELGVTSSVSRQLADHRDDLDRSIYGCLLIAGFFAFFIQGVVILLIGLLISFYGSFFFQVPSELKDVFRNVLLMATFSSCLSIFFRAFGTPLWAYNRQDVTYILSMISLTLDLLLLCYGFKKGWGIYSLPIAMIPGIILAPLCSIWICLKNGYYPKKSDLKQPGLVYFRRIYTFAKDSFLINLGSQLVNASQVLILGRFAGLDSVAAYTVGTKMLSMGQQCVSKIIETSAPELTQSYIKNKPEKFTSRFWIVMALTVFLASLGASLLILINTPFVHLWSREVIIWNRHLDLILGILLVTTSTTRCLMALFGITGNLSPVRYIYFIEGILFVILAIPSTLLFGINGILCSSIFSQIVVTGFGSVKASRRFLPSTKQLIRLLIGSLLTISPAVCLFMTRWVPVGQINFGSSWIFIIVLISCLGWFSILPSKFRIEIVQVLKRF
jgi:O-antigen/teichoic acid export membrane protein